MSEENGVLRLYNMYPRSYGSISAMTAALPAVAQMGFNAVWVNPIQASAGSALPKTDMHTGIVSAVAGSLYAMGDTDLLDADFSVVARDKAGNPIFTKEQRQSLLALSDAEITRLFSMGRQSLRRLVQGSAVDTTRLLASMHDVAASAEAESQSLAGVLFRVRGKIAVQQRVMRVLYREQSADAGAEQLMKARKKRVKKIRAQESSVKQSKHHAKCVVATMQEAILSTRLLQQAKVKRVIAYLDGQALRCFTDAARQLGMTPLFDLVMNHVAEDSLLVASHPSWFKRDSSFLDVRAFRYEDTRVQDEVFETIWKPYIRKYVVDYGFDGIRVDCVRKLPHRLRAKVYAYLRDQVRAAGRRVSPIIFEELLFSDGEPFPDASAAVEPTGATHITASVFYADREWHGGISPAFTEEQGVKAAMVETGCVNFTGSHDHGSAAQMVLRSMAFERLSEDAGLEAALRAAGQSAGIRGASDAYKAVFSAGVIESIKAEMVADPAGSTATRYRRLLRDRVALNQFAGSGGYYMLCGDERGSMTPTAIFKGADGQRYYPQRQHVTLVAPREAVVELVLNEMAEALMCRFAAVKNYYDGLAADAVQRRREVLHPFKSEVIRRINRCEPFYKNTYAAAMEARGCPVKFDRSQFVRVVHTPENAWGTPEALQVDMRHFIRENNTIMSKLRRPTRGTWSHQFMLQDHVAVTVRLNSLGFRSGAEVIVTNLAPGRLITVGWKEMKQVTSWFQQRCFPPVPGRDYYASYASNPQFHEAWGCIMGRAGMPSMRLYLGGGLRAEGAVEDHVVTHFYKPPGLLDVRMDWSAAFLERQKADRQAVCAVASTNRHGFFQKNKSKRVKGKVRAASHTRAGKTASRR